MDWKNVWCPQYHYFLVSVQFFDLKSTFKVLLIYNFFVSDAQVEDLIFFHNDIKSGLLITNKTAF